MTALTITAHLVEQTSGIVGQPFLLDGPLAWAEATRPDRDYPPISKEHAPEIPLPLNLWEQDGDWGWRVSRAHYIVAAQTVLEIRKKPADKQLATYTTERKNHHGLGPHKARDLVIPTALIPAISWDVDCADQEWLRLLLDRITHLGSHRALGLGRIRSWDITPGTPDAWKDRPYADPLRPPYWHHQRKDAC